MGKINAIIDLELEVKAVKSRDLKRYLNYIIDNIEAVGTNTILEENYKVVKKELEERNINVRKYVEKYDNARSSPE